MNDFVALIAAGGRATRMREDGRPKSLIPIDGSCLLRACITNTQAVGCQRILVTTNRPDWAPAYEEICYGFQDVVLNFDDGYGSTFLLNQALIDQMAPTYLFQYGHAPRSTEELGELLHPAYYSGLRGLQFVIASRADSIWEVLYRATVSPRSQAYCELGSANVEGLLS